MLNGLNMNILLTIVRDLIWQFVLRRIGNEKRLSKLMLI